MDAIYKTTQDLENWLSDFHIPEHYAAILVNPQYVEKPGPFADHLLPEDDQHWEIGVHARDTRDLDWYNDSTTRFDTALNLYDDSVDGFWQVYGEVVKELHHEFPDAELYYTDFE